MTFLKLNSQLMQYQQYAYFYIDCIFLAFYSPFEDRVIQITNIITEFGISIIFLLLTPYFFDLGQAGIDIMDNLIMCFTTCLVVVQATGPFINSIKELYIATKRSLNENSQSNQIKMSKSPKKHDLNNLDNFFDDTNRISTTEKRIIIM
ncbi:unnamed protein product [Blepharisma stoltei]|uniref:Uncharacterized protein n=1 Tax=Blepharisma stoltei TaxID=1481888 RepID=A0AAU9KDY9_9CILI|nr:unnamed protein product [Blepharisma stoltei]